MAACGAMSLSRGILAACLAVLLVAGCSKVVDGQPVAAVPPPGSPIRWGPCPDNDPQAPIPPEAECGKLSVPVDYAKPDGNVAQLAMIRFKATGDKIGSLVINPGGPGESGVKSAANLVAMMPPSVRERFDLVGFRSARSRGIHARGAVQLRRGQRPAAGRSSSRLFAGRHRPHRQRDQGVRAALPRQDG